MMDVVLSSQREGCSPGSGRIRFYLFDMPEGFSMRILTIAVFSSQSRFETVSEAAKLIVDSIEFHAP